MSSIDGILSDIEKKIECCNDWHVEIISKASVDKGKVEASYLWDAESPVAAKAIKEYLVAMGMNDGMLAEPQGSFIYVFNRKQHKP